MFSHSVSLPVFLQKIRKIMCFLNFSIITCAFVMLHLHYHLLFCRVKGDSQAWKDSQVCPDFQDQKDQLVQEVQR